VVELSQGWLTRYLQPLDDRGIRHTATFTHRLERKAASPLLKRIDHGGHDASTAGAERVADRDGAAVDIGLGQIGSGVGGPGQDDGRADASLAAGITCRIW
jgi:hypothetical protein